MKKTLTTLCFVLIFVTMGFAQQQQPSKMVEVPENMLSETQKAHLEMNQIKEKAEMYGNWVGLGKEVGSAVDGALGALTNRAEEFSKTGVGKFTMFIVLWKILGHDVIQAVVGIPLLIVGFTVWIWAFRKNCIQRSVLIKEHPDKTKEYQVINTELSAEEKWGHVVVLAVFFVMCVSVIFA